MAQAPIYRPGEAAPSIPTPQRDPAAFGGQIGQSLSGLADAGMRLGQVERQLDQEAAGFAFQKASAEAANETDTFANDLKTKLPAGAPGYAQQVIDHFDAGSEAALGNITDARQREKAMQQVAQQRSDVMLRAQAWERSQGAEKIANDGAAAVDARSTSLYGNPSLASYELIRQQNAGTFSSTDLLTGNQREKAVAQANAQAFRSGVEGLIAQDRFAEAAGWLSSEYAGELGGEAVAVLGRQIEAGKRSTEAAQRTAFNLGKSQATSAAELVKQRLAAGEQVPDAELAQVQALVAQYGEDNKVYDLGVARSRSAINQETKSWMPAQYDAEIQRLRALGANASAPDQVRLHQLEDIATTRKAEVERDPASFLATNGAPPPALDAGNPGSWAQRGAWADGASRALGRPVPLLSDAEASPLIATLRTGNVDQKMEVAGTVLRAGGQGKRVLDQIAADNPEFRAAVTLAANNDGGQTMRDALAGPDVLKANPGLLKPEKDEASGKPGPTHQQIFASTLSQATALLPPAYQASLLANATNIYASRAGRQGWTVFHPNEFQKAMRYALGGRDVAGGWQGGLGTWGGQAVVLPRGINQAGFDARLSRATGAQWGAASLHGVPWAGNRPVTNTEMRGLVPVMVRDGVYALRQGNSFLTTRAGGRYEFDIRKLP